MDFKTAIGTIVASAARRQGLTVPTGGPRRRRPPEPLRIGFTYNIKRIDTKGGNDSEAEYDGPETIDSIKEALESYGHIVIPFEATPNLPACLHGQPVNLVFNIAEGVSGRTSVMPALCELMGVFHTGSGCGHAVDRARQGAVEAGVAAARHLHRGVPGHGDRTGAAVFQVEVPSNPQAQPGRVVEGGQRGVASVVDDEAGLRAVVRDLIERYAQPALIEDYITGREFTVGLLGDKHPRVPPGDGNSVQGQGQRPPGLRLPDQAGVEEEPIYNTPGQVGPDQLKAIERVSGGTFEALTAQMTWPGSTCGWNTKGDFYVIEVNPLPQG